MAVSAEKIAACRRRYKNRKKTIRRSYQSGAIDSAERQRRLDEAWLDYCLAIGKKPKWYHIEQRDRVVKAADYLAGDDVKARSAKTAIQQGDCNEECVGARGLYCRCGCKGVNHGAAYGTEPWMVSVVGMTISERIDAGVLDAYEIAQRRLKAAGFR